MATRSPYAKGLARQSEILDAAFEVFRTMGYDRASLREIARRAGVSQGGLLHHFKGKEALFLALLKRRDDRTGEHEAAPGPTHSVDGLVGAVRRDEGEVGLVRLFVTLLAEGAAEPGEIHDYLRERYRNLRGELAIDVLEKQERGLIRSDLDPADIAAVMVSAADGLELQWLLEPEAIDPGRLLGRLRDMLHCGLDGSAHGAPPAETPGVAEGSNHQSLGRSAAPPAGGGGDAARLDAGRLG